MKETDKGQIETGREAVTGYINRTIKTKPALDRDVHRVCDDLTYMFYGDGSAEVIKKLPIEEQELFKTEKGKVKFGEDLIDFLTKKGRGKKGTYGPPYEEFDIALRHDDIKDLYYFHPIGARLVVTVSDKDGNLIGDEIIPEGYTDRADHWHLNKALKRQVEDSKLTEDQRITVLKEDVERLEDADKTGKRLYKKVKGEYKELDKEHKKLVGSNTELNDNYEILEKEKKELEDKELEMNKKFEADLLEMKNKREALEAEKLEKKKEYDGNLEVLTDEYKELEEIKEKLDGEHRLLVKKNTKLNDSYGILEEQKKGLDEENEALVGSNSELSDRYGILENEKIDLDEEHRTLVKSNIELNDNYKIVERQKRKLEIELKELKNNYKKPEDSGAEKPTGIKSPPKGSGLKKPATLKIKKEGGLEGKISSLNLDNVPTRQPVKDSTPKPLPAVQQTSEPSTPPVTQQPAKEIPKEVSSVPTVLEARTPKPAAQPEAQQPASQTPAQTGTSGRPRPPAGSRKRRRNVNSDTSIPEQ